MKYLVTFATKGLDAAASFSTYDGAINYLNDCIDAANIKIADFGSYAPNCFKMILNDGRDFNIRIEHQADADVRYDLKIAKNEKLVETRRFINREYAAAYAHRLLRSKGFTASKVGDAEGFWMAKDASQLHEIGITLAVLGGSKNNDYDILGIKSGASEDEIKKAYRAKVKENHPDRGGDTAKFEKIQKAYERITKGQASARNRFVKKYYDSRDMVLFFEEYGNATRQVKPQKSNNIRFDFRAELENARQQANNTIGSGAILLALGGAIFIFIITSDEYSFLVMLAAGGLIGWGVFRLVCGFYYQNKIEKLLRKFKR